jgi:hypothetical protein
VYDEDLKNLEEWLRRLKIEYHIFFSGNRKKPPDDLKMRVEKIVKKLSECSDMTFSERFRFNTLITRFYVYRDLWRRTLMEREIGAETKMEANSAATASLPLKAPTEAFQISISDPKEEEEKIRLLYNELLRLKKSDSKDTPLSYQQFSKYIATQTHRIQSKHGCFHVVFTMALEEDAIRFTASAEKP